MRLYEFDIPNLRFSDWQTKQGQNRVATYIEQHCSDILSVYQNINRFLYRGIDGATAPLIFGETPTNRPAKDTPCDIHERINNIFRESNFIARRDNSIFCTSRKDRARDYGRLYVIFPMNGFNYTWSTEIEDMYEDCYYADQKFSQDEFLNLLFNHSSAAFIKRYGFVQNEGISAALESNHEILIHGTYIAIDVFQSAIFDLLSLSD